MKKATKILICLGAFAAAQAVVAGILFIGYKGDITSSYRNGVEYNFSKMAEAVGLKADNQQDINLDDVFLYNFDNVLIIERDGYIKYLSNPSANFYEGGLFDVDTGDGLNLSNLFDTDKIILSEYRIAGDKSLLFSKNFGDLTLIAYESLAYEQSLLNNFILRLVVVSAIQLALVSAAVLFFGLFKNGKDSKGIRFSQDMFEGRNFIFEINKKGDLVHKKHSQFLLQYDVNNLGDYYVDNNVSLAKALSEKMPFSLLLTDRSGSQKYFRCIASRSVNGYKILAMNDSQFLFENKQISEQIFLEPVTALRNKSAFEADLEQYLQEGQKKQASVAFFNIHNLETLETLFSNNNKEKLLKSCAAILRQRYNNIARLYFIDNKFSIFSTSSSATEEVKQSLSDFNTNLNAVIRNEGNSMQILTDVTFLYIDDSENFRLDDLIEYSEYMRMNLKGRISSSVISEIFTKSKYRHAVGNKKDLTRKIIETNSFHLFYQPQFSLKDNKIVAFESLVRLNEPSITTQDFILISEANGYMLQLGEQILNKAFLFASKIKKARVPICINLSPIQLMNKGFVDNFIKNYEKYQLSKNSIALEITETFLMRDVSENIKKLEIIHKNGVGIHLDDFGMGYSSLAYLKNIPLDSIKIDREFVSSVDKDDYSRAICQFIVATARQLGKETIAEGVETQSQLDCLKKIGCDIVQGYLTSRPMSEENAVALLKGAGAAL